MISDRMLAAVRKEVRHIEENKEALLKAWVAQHGWAPDECLMVTQEMGDGKTKTWVERRDDQKYGPLNAWRQLKSELTDNRQLFEGFGLNATALLDHMKKLEATHGVKP